eukprot:8401092-Pyramimonas_sp.AAC.1
MRMISARKEEMRSLEQPASASRWAKEAHCRERALQDAPHDALRERVAHDLAQLGLWDAGHDDVPVTEPLQREKLGHLGAA